MKSKAWGLLHGMWITFGASKTLAVKTATAYLSGRFERVTERGHL